MHLMVVSGDVVYGHLGAYSEIGYRVDASYALHAWEIEYFRGKAEWIDWGRNSVSQTIRNTRWAGSTQAFLLMCGRCSFADGF